MSVKHWEVITCPQCCLHNKHRFRNSYRVSLFLPRWRFSSIFVQKCPFCGHRYVIPHPCLYHDPWQRFMVFLIPHTTENIIRFDEEYHPKSYIYRLESDLNATLERVRLLTEGIDDRLFEIYRASLFPAIQRKDAHVKRIFEKREKNDAFVFLVFKNGDYPDYKIHVSSEPYRTMLPLFLLHESSKENFRFERIDHHWAKKSGQMYLFSNIDFNFNIAQ